MVGALPKVTQLKSRGTVTRSTAAWLHSLQTFPSPPRLLTFNNMGRALGGAPKQVEGVSEHCPPHSFALGVPRGTLTTHLAKGLLRSPSTIF